jgi:SAM-dependent methyltransferase
LHGEHDGAVVRRFDSEARDFARSPFHRDPERLKRFLDLAAPVPGEAALDVGASVTAVDLTPGMLREAQGSGARLLRADALRLPFRDACFDLVLCRNSFHHFPDPPTACAEAARVLRAGGRLAYEDMAAAEDLPERDLQETIERLRDRAHARTLPPGEVRGLLEAAGLRVTVSRLVPMTVDFDEWIDRPRPSAAARARARFLMEARREAPAGTLRSFVEEGRLRFERNSLLLLAVKG